jgi:hypothetical protein
MKTKKMITRTFASLLMLAFCFTTGNSFAQTKTDSTKMKDCCMMKDCCIMKDGKMMMMKNGKMMPMDKEMTMKNGTKCMTNGECVMKDGKKMMMKEGDCMDMSGKMDKCSMNKDTKKSAATTYTCSMHPEVTSDKPGKCPRCGMELIEKK